LARKHHPDKLTNISDEEKAKHEAIFKEISGAYSDIEHDLKHGTGFTYTRTTNHEDWRSVWNDIEALFQSPDAWERMASIVKSTVRDVTVEGLKQLKTHHIKIKITLEEAHMKKQKRVRLFLSDIDEPIFVTVETSEYPIMDIKHVLPNGLPVNIAITMELVQHPIYRFDDVLDSWDLFTIVETTWLDYIKGKNIMLRYIDGSDININLLPFKTYNAPICFENQGLCGLGNLYVSVEMRAPTIRDMSSWNNVSDDKKYIFLEVLGTLY
jgi:DnaJ-class molecular chaperone